MEEFEAIRDSPDWLAAEDRRLQRLSRFQESMRMGGSYEVAEKVRAGALSGAPASVRARRAGGG